MAKLHADFWQHVQQTPQAPALEIGDDCYSYEALSHYVAALQTQIRSSLSTDAHQEVIGIWAEKDLTAYSAVLGILSAGQIYAPLGVKLPVHRLQNIIEQSDMGTLIVSPTMAHQLPTLLEGMPAKHIICLAPMDDALKEQCKGHRLTVLKVDASPRDAAHIAHIADNALGQSGELAYLLFTSGSTGVPKGVPISHQNACAYLDHISSLIAFHATDRFSQNFPLTFDLSVHDMFLCWRAGGCLCPIPDKMMMAPTKLVQEKRINIWFSVPSQAALMQQFRQLKPEALSALRVSLFCGEALPLEIVHHWHSAAPQSRIYNIYGPTEATIAITCYDATPCAAKPLKQRNGVVSVGKLFATQSCRLDAPNEAGEGELLLSGAQVAKHYWKNPQATERAFIEDAQHQLWYKTGDLFAQDSQGDLFFISRLDHQIKLHGHRIELEEINHVIREYTGQSHVCTIVAGEGASAYLAAFIASQDQQDEAALQQHLHEKLPPYMTPKSVRYIEHMPTNSSGKIDRQALNKLL